MIVDGELPEGAVILRRTSAIRYLDPETGEAEVAVTADDGSDADEQSLDIGAHLGDLQVAQFALWDQRHG